MTTFPAWNQTTAEYLARAMHNGQVDKSGHIYIGHPRRVVERVKYHHRFQLLSEGEKQIALMVAWLHDVIEDTSMTLSALLALGCPEEVCNRVWMLTRLSGQQPTTYYRLIKTDPITLMIKECDVEDNTDPRRLVQLDEPTRSRLETKYAKAKVMLGMNT